MLRGLGIDLYSRELSRAWHGEPCPAAASGLTRIVKRKLKKIQYRPHLIDGCLAAADLTIEPW